MTWNSLTEQYMYNVIYPSHFNTLIKTHLPCEAFGKCLEHCKFQRTLETWSLLMAAVLCLPSHSGTAQNVNSQWLPSRPFHQESQGKPSSRQLDYLITKDLKRLPIFGQHNLKRADLSLLLSRNHTQVGERKRVRNTDILSSILNAINSLVIA